MGFIYKITNKINGNIYIGQTRQSIETRWKDHIRSSSKTHKDYNCPLHLAIAKYGEDNFIIEKIEECDENILDEREKYWINKYNSYYKGYNASLGGSGHIKYNYDKIVNYYLQHNYSLIDTCKHFHIYDQIVYNALRSKNIDYITLQNKTIKNKYNKKILLVEKQLIFNKISDIDKYFNKTAHPNIRRCLNGITKKAYGFHWKEIEDIEITQEMQFYE